MSKLIDPILQELLDENNYFQISTVNQSDTAMRLMDEADSLVDEGILKEIPSIGDIRTFTYV